MGISIFLEHLYYNDAALRAIKQINKYAGGEAVSVNIKPMAKPPVEIKVVHDLNQPMADSQNSGQGKTHVDVVLDKMQLTLKKLTMTLFQQDVKITVRVV